MANEQLAQLAKLLGGGNQRFYTAGPAASAGPIVAPQESASTADQFLARALGGRAPDSLGAGIFSASQSIANALEARSKKQQAETDQEKQAAAARTMLAQLTQGQPGALNASETPMVPAADAPMADQAQAMGLDRPAGEMTTGGTPPAFDPNGATARLVEALVGSGQVMPALNFMGQTVTAQEAAKAKAVEQARALKADLFKQTHKAGLDREGKTLTPEAYAQQVAINAARAGYQAGPGGGL